MPGPAPPVIGRRTAIGLALGGGAAAALWLRPAVPLARLSPPEAHGLAATGDLILVDIRRPDEWQQTGLGDGAVPIDLRDADFRARLDHAAGGDAAARIALICARGVRSRRLAIQLVRAGYISVWDVPEGMLGSSAGAGWIARGLPVHPVRPQSDAILKG